MKTCLLLASLLRRLTIAGLVLVMSLIVAIPAARATATIKDIATDATDPSNLSDTEPSIAVNPINPQEIAVVAFSEPWDPNDPTVMAPVWKSRDGGVTWKKIPQIPRPVAGAGGPFDQKIAFDASGKLYVAEIGGSACFVYRQTGTADAPLTVGAAYGVDQ